MPKTQMDGNVPAINIIIMTIEMPNIITGRTPTNFIANPPIGPVKKTIFLKIG